MRPETPAPLTLQEHRELARELRAANARMGELSKMMLSVYGPNNQAAFTFQKVADSLDRLCQDMRAQAILDCPGFPVDDLYG